jgi:hypothetical protein
MKSHHDSNELSKNSFSKHAPKVWTLLCKALSKEAESAATRMTISNVFEALATGGLLEHPGIKREVGVSFNPRPARLLEILLREYQTLTPEQMTATLLTVLIEPPCSDLSIISGLPNLDSTEPMARAIILFEQNLGERPLEAKNIPIAMARSLDILRHGHMSNLELKEKSQFMKIASSLLDASKTDTSLARLRVLIETASSRFKKDLQL